MCIYIVRYEWDERKNRLNQRKHGVSFEMAAMVFEDPRCLISFDREDETGERRWHAIGSVAIGTGPGAILPVAHVYRHPTDVDLSAGAPREDRDGEEIIRIISARPAQKNDFRRYQEQEVDES